MYRSSSCPPGQCNFHASATDPPPPQTLDDVYVCVHSVLTNLAASLSSAECTSYVTGMVYSAVHRAVADFAATWNDNAPVTLPALPSELLISCLSHLSLRDKISASHVCWRWRRFILSVPTLWDTIDTARTRYPHAVDFFRAVIVRSGTVKLGVNLRAGWHPHIDLDNTATRALLTEVSSRLRSLALSLPMHFSNNFDLFETFEAPVLEDLLVDGKHTTNVVPFPRNGNALMPRLKHLVLDRILIPDDSKPMPGVETFECYCYPEADMRNLFVIFPRLTSATLRELQSALTLPGAIPPATLVSATISVRSDYVDPVDILRALVAVPQCNVELSTMHYQVSPGMEMVGLLAGTHAGPWRLSLTSGYIDSEVTVRRNSDTAFEIILESPDLHFPSGSPGNVSPEAFAQAPFERLQAMTLSGRTACVILAAGAHFPALEELTLVDEDYGPESMLRLASEGVSLPPLRAPALRALTLRLNATWYAPPEECTVNQLHHFVSSRLRYSAERLQQVTIVHCNTINTDCLARCLPDLDKLAARILSVTTEGEEWLTLTPQVTEIEDDTPPVFALVDD